MIKLILFILFLFIINCSNSSNIDQALESEESPEFLYKIAMIDLQSQKYTESSIKFSTEYS